MHSACHSAAPHSVTRNDPHPRPRPGPPRDPLRPIGRPRPFAEILGLQVLAGHPGLARPGLELRRELLNSVHDAQGGVVTTLPEVALAAITGAGAVRGATTVNCSVRFVGPGRERLVAEARGLRAGGELAFSEGEVRDAAGNLVAEAVGTSTLRR